MTHRNVVMLAIAAALTTPLTACGYHHIGAANVPAKEETAARPSPQRVSLPRKEDTFAAMSSYFPLQPGTVYTYSRTYDDQGAVGTRVMTVSSSDDGESWVNNRIETGGDAMALAYAARVTQSARRLTVAVPSFPGVHTLQGFVLKDNLKANAVWEAEIEGRAWSFAVRKSEHVTVPAGTYDCLVLEASNRSAGIGMVQMTKQTLYFASGVGLVKVVIKVDEQGEKLVMSHELTEALTSVTNQ
jgi:hypothetical protein